MRGFFGGDSSSDPVRSTIFFFGCVCVTLGGAAGRGDGARGTGAGADGRGDGARGKGADGRDACAGTDGSGGGDG